MKTFVIFFAACLFVAVSALTDEQKAKLKEHKDACLLESGVDADKVEKAKNGEIDETDRKFACFSSCMLKKIGIMNADGKFDVEVTRSKIPAEVPVEKAEAVITKCKDITDPDVCDAGRKIYKCYVDNKDFTIGL